MSGPSTYGHGEIFIHDTPESRKAFLDMGFKVRVSDDDTLADYILSAGEIEVGRAHEGVNLCGYNGDHYGYKNGVNLEGLLLALKEWADDGYIELLDQNMKLWKLEIKSHKFYIYEGKATYTNKKEII